MVEFHTGQYRRARAVVQELGALVEIGRLVFVPLNDELLSTPQLKAPLLAPENSTDQPGGVPSLLPAHPGHQSGGSGLAVSSCDHYRVSILEKELIDCLGKAPVLQPAAQDLFRFLIRAGDDVPDYHQVRAPIQVGGKIARQETDPLALQHGGDGGIDILVRPADLVSRCGQESRQGTHAGTTDTDEVNFENPSGERSREALESPAFGCPPG